MGTIPKRKDTKPRGALKPKKKRNAKSSETRERKERGARRHITSLLAGKQLCRLSQGASLNPAQEEGNMLITEHNLQENQRQVAESKEERKKERWEGQMLECNPAKSTVKKRSQSEQDCLNLLM